MASFGDKLKRERELREISLEEVAAATKIAPRYLEALERDAFDDLPGEVFTKGYIRAYAKFVGLDAEALVEAYTAERAPGEESAADDREFLKSFSRLVEGSTPRSRWRSVSWRTATSAVVAVAVVALGVWAYRARPQRSAPAKRPPVAGGAPTDTPAPTPPAEVERAVRPTRGAQPPEAPPPEPATPVDRDAAEESSAGPGTTVRRAQDGEHRDPPAVPTQAPPDERGRTSGPSPYDFVTDVDHAAEEGSADDEALSVPDFGVGTRVVNRQLEGRDDTFEEGTRVWFWTRVLGGQPGESIRHVWIREGRHVATTELQIGGPHWRTQSRKTMRPGSAGSWAVEVRDAEDRVLARQEFRCVEGEAAAEPDS